MIGCASSVCSVDDAEELEDGEEDDAMRDGCWRMA